MKSNDKLGDSLILILSRDVQKSEEKKINLDEESTDDSEKLIDAYETP